MLDSVIKPLLFTLTRIWIYFSDATICIISLLGHSNDVQTNDYCLIIHVVRIIK